MVIGVYVGCATVFGYAWWFIYYSGGPQITFWQLVSGMELALQDLMLMQGALLFRLTSISAAPSSRKLDAKCSATITLKRPQLCRYRSWSVSS
jgi:hypothetical protein